MVFYRKYRPQSLTELIGQDNIKSSLLNAFQSQKLAHAYLFCGPRGTGKTSTARILAKMVNCEAETAPCNTCATCLSITDGSNLDLIEIDAASNRGIDDIRELRERVKLSPTAAKKKVYIIDEVHMLTNEAFNALLKTLEEPPAHVLFILATTETQKIPQTILSRVSRMDFKLASPEDLLSSLKRVVEQEKLVAEEDALRLIAKRAEGGFRDCLKLLDQLASGGGKLTVSLVEESLKTGKSDDVILLLESISSKNSAKALETVEKQVLEGTNLKEFLSSLQEVLREMLFIKSGVVRSDNLVVKQLSEKFEIHQLTRLTQSLINASEDMKFASIQSLPLEIAVVENCFEMVEQRAQITQVQETTSNFKGNSETIKLTQVVQDSVILESLTTGSESSIEEISTVFESKVDDVASTDMLTLRDKWQFVLETIKPYNFSLEALLKQAKLISCSEGQVMLEVPYSFHQRVLEAPKSRDLLESVLSDILGKTARVSCVLGKRPVRVEEIANVELAQDDEVVKIAAEIFNSES